MNSISSASAVLPARAPRDGSRAGSRALPRTPRRKASASPAHPSADEVNALLKEYAETRDPRLRDRLVFMHERMVRYLASRFGHAAGTTIEDLVQVGYIGLISAIDRYDPSKGVNFVTYAVPTILGEIKRYFRDQTWGLKAPRRLRELGLSLRRIREELEQRLGRPPTIAEMAHYANVSEERPLQAMDLDRIYQPASLDAQLADDSGAEKATVWEAIGEEDPQMARVEEKEALRRALERLEERQQEIIQMRFYEELSQAEVARRLGISQMHVSRLERQALTKRRHLLTG